MMGNNGIGLLATSAAMALVAALMPAQTAAYDWSCNLYCYNGGTCTHGTGKFGSYQKILEDANQKNKETTNGELDDVFGDDEPKTHVERMYCECPMFYTGLQCEIKLTECPDSQKCFNGKHCKKGKTNKESERPFFHCECDAAETDFTLHEKDSLKYCDHISRKFCDVRDDAGSSTGGSDSYCTNGARCLTKNDPDANLNSVRHHLGCQCPEEFYGDYCEIMKDEYKANVKAQFLNITESQKEGAKLVGLWIAGAIVATIVLAVVARRLQQLRRFKRRQKKARAKRHYPPPSTTGDVGRMQGGATYA